MRIGVIEAGSPPERLSASWGSYVDMTKHLLGHTFTYCEFHAPTQRLPTTAHGCDAYVITGSAAAAYDPDPWIRQLETFIRSAAGATPLIGVCFGHQVIAQALGGSVRRHPGGWGIGLHHYVVNPAGRWPGGVDAVSLPASHQDQVVSLGPGGRVLASSAFTPIAVADYPALKCVTLQAHPEFEPGFAAALVQERRGGLYTEAQAAQALRSLEEPNDRALVARWLRDFLTTAL